MPLLPVAAREARSASRSWRNYAWRTTIALIGLALIPTIISTSKNPAFLGPQIFLTLTRMAFLYAVIAGVLRTADSISEEKRENTLGLLFLTDLKAYDVLTGKLLTSTATIFFGLLAILPLLTIPLLMGGVTAQQLILISLNLINTLFLSISVGFLMSTLLRQSWAAICLGLVFMFFLVLALPQLIVQYSNATGPSPTAIALARILLLFSPTMAFDHLLSPGITPGLLLEFYWAPLAATHLLAWFNIFLTLHYLPIVWRDNARSVRGQRWWDRIQAIRFGGRKTRTKFRTRLLKSNPLFWLAGRQQVSSSGLMLFMVGVVPLSLAGGWGGILSGLVTLHLVLLANMACAASQNLAEDRKSGALELLLGTSLSIRDILRGRWMALGRRFFGPILIVSLWHLFAIIWTAMLGRYDETSFAIFCVFPIALLAWVATGWSGMWLGLRAHTPNMASFITFTVVVLAPAFFLSLLATATGQWSPGLAARDNATAIFTGLLLWGIYLSFLSSYSANRLRTKFRQAASDRFIENLAFDWRPVRRFASRFAFLLVAISSFVVFWYWSVEFRGERAFQRVLAAHPEFSRQSPEPPSIPSEKNLARWDLFNAMEEAPVQVRGGRRPASLRELISPHNRPPNEFDWMLGQKLQYYQNFGTLNHVKRYDQDFKWLHIAAGERPFFRFVPTKNAVFSPIQSLHGVQFYLCARACGRISAGERPLDDSLLALRFATAATNYANDFPHLQTPLFHAIQPIYDGIQTAVWSDADLLAIQRAYSQIDLFPILDQWRFEVTRRLVDFLENDSAVTTTIFDYTFSKQNPPPQRGRIHQQQAAIIKFGLDDWSALVNRQKRTLRPNNYNNRIQIVRDFQYITQQAIRQTARAQTAADQVTVACAIERFRLATGRIPQNLSELVPKYLERIPNDIALGEPLKYRPEADQKSYVVYSVGFDLIDQQGRGSPADWTWICKR